MQSAQIALGKTSIKAKVQKGEDTGVAQNAHSHNRVVPAEKPLLSDSDGFSGADGSFGCGDTATQSLTQIRSRAVIRQPSLSTRFVQGCGDVGNADVEKGTNLHKHKSKDVAVGTASESAPWWQRPRVPASERCTSGSLVHQCQRQCHQHDMATHVHTGLGWFASL